MRVRAPFSAVEIEINHACNRNCSYCPNSALERLNQGEIAPSLYLKLMTELRGLEFDGRVSFHFYNEPLLHSDFEGVLATTRAQLPAARLELYSNGTRLDAERTGRLFEIGLNKLIVTQHEADVRHRFEEVYRSMRDPRIIYRPYTAVNLTNRGGLLNHLGEGGLPLRPCHIPSEIVVVTVNGNVLPCFEDFNETLVMGNLNQQSLLEIWNSERYTTFRDELRKGLRHRHGICSACNRRESIDAM